MLINKKRYLLILAVCIFFTSSAFAVPRYYYMVTKNALDDSQISWRAAKFEVTREQYLDTGGELCGKGLKSIFCSTEIIPNELFFEVDFHAAENDSRFLRMFLLGSATLAIGDLREGDDYIENKVSYSWNRHKSFSSTASLKQFELFLLSRQKYQSLQKKVKELPSYKEVPIINIGASNDYGFQCEKREMQAECNQ